MMDFGSIFSSIGAGLGILFVAGLILIPIMLILMRQGNTRITIYEVAGKGYRKKYMKGNYNSVKAELTIFDKLIGGTKIEHVPADAMDMGGDFAFILYNGTYTPLTETIDLNAVRLHPLLNPATEIMIKDRIYKNAKRTTQRKDNLLNSPVVAVILVGLILIGAIYVGVSPLSNAATELSNSNKALTNAIAAQNPQTNSTQNTGTTSPFTGKTPPPIQ